MSAKLIYRFSAEKNLFLKQERKISFDDIIFAIENGKLLDTRDHYSKQYPHQKLYIVEINAYAYAVPYVEKDDEIFLKTIYPSRMMTKRYLRKDEI